MKPVQVKVSDSLHLILSMIKSIESENLSKVLEKALIFYIKNYDKIYKNKYQEPLSQVYIDIINKNLAQL